MTFTLTLAVSDLERTADFYGELLELAIERFLPMPGHPPVLLLGHGEATVLFRETAALEALHPALFQNLERHPRGVGVTLEFSVGELNPLLKKFARQQLHTLYELEDEEFNRREVWLHDPDGYLVILSEEPAAPA
jgi:catechol 2,3-dioxygenase-like lactoylglutathione lyase family enzyme